MRPALAAQSELFRVQFVEQFVLNALALVLLQVDGPEKREYRNVVLKIYGILIKRSDTLGVAGIKPRIGIDALHARSIRERLPGKETPGN